MTILSLQSNRLLKLENLDALVQLEEIYLSENGISKIEGLDKLTNLRVLDLGLNRIERIENVQHLKKLEEFWFNGNNLSRWEDIELLRELDSLKCLYLEHNPIYYVNNKKPTSNEGFAADKQMINSSYRRKVILTLPNLEQLDATLCAKPSIANVQPGQQ